MKIPFPQAMINRTSFFVLLMVGLTLKVCSQATIEPLFQTTFYVEDALGNRDSVVLGFDPQGTESLNPLFGEIEQAWIPGAVLEARVSSDIYSFSKKKITLCEVYPSESYAVAAIFFFVKAQHQPLTFYWDHEAIQNVGPYQQYAFMTPDMIPILQDTYEWNQTPGRRGTCLTSHGSYTVTLTWDAAVENEVSLYPSGTAFESPDAALGLIVFFSMYYEASYCSRTDDATEPSRVKQVPVHPNPATDMIHLNLAADSYSRVVLMNAAGCIVKVFENTSGSSSTNLDVSELPQGYYLVQAMSENQAVAIGKFIKIE